MYENIAETNKNVVDVTTENESIKIGKLETPYDSINLEKTSTNSEEVVTGNPLLESVSEDTTPTIEKDETPVETPVETHVETHVEKVDSKNMVDFSLHQYILSDTVHEFTDGSDLKIKYKEILNDDGKGFGKYAVILTALTSDNKTLEFLSPMIVSKEFLVTLTNPLVENLIKNYNMEIEYKNIIDSSKVLTKMKRKNNEDFEVSDLVKSLYGLDNCDIDVKMTLSILNGYGGTSKLFIMPGIKITSSEKSESKIDIDIPFDNFKVEFIHYKNIVNITMNLDKILSNMKNMFDTLKTKTITKETYMENIQKTIKNMYKKLDEVILDSFDVFPNMNGLFLVMLMSKWFANSKSISNSKYNSIFTNVFDKLVV